MQDQLEFYRKKLEFETDPSDLFEAMMMGEKVIPIDARKAIAYETEHIPGAISLPHGEMNEDTTRHFDREMIYVVYCDGIGCNASTKGALNMTRLGFRVKELIGGIEWWKSDSYATEGTQAKTDGALVQCAC